MFRLSGVFLAWPGAQNRSIPARTRPKTPTPIKAAARNLRTETPIQVADDDGTLPAGSTAAGRFRRITTPPGSVPTMGRDLALIKRPNEVTTRGQFPTSGGRSVQVVVHACRVDCVGRNRCGPSKLAVLGDESRLVPAI